MLDHTPQVHWTRRMSDSECVSARETSGEQRMMSRYGPACDAMQRLNSTDRGRSPRRDMYAGRVSGGRKCWCSHYQMCSVRVCRFEQIRIRSTNTERRTEYTTESEFAVSVPYNKRALPFTNSPTHSHSLKQHSIGSCSSVRHTSFLRSYKRAYHISTNPAAVSDTESRRQLDAHSSATGGVCTL